jgi:glycosyltransferase involved in cell wall biosynthesis
MKSLFVYPAIGITRISGSASSLMELCRIMKEMGEVIVVIPETEERVAISSYSRLYRFARYLLPPDLSPWFFWQTRSVMKKERPDVVFCSSLPGSILLRLVVGRKAKFIFIAHIYEQGYIAKRKPARRYFIQRTYVRFREGIACKLSNHIISVSELDKKHLGTAYTIEPSNITVIQPENSDMVTRDKMPRDTARRLLALPENVPIVLFHGNMLHHPNRTAVRRIVDTICPKVCGRMPDVKFLLAGAYNKEYLSDHIISMGFVEDLIPLIDSADIAVLPMNIGGGVRIKMMDYMSRGTPVIATPEALEGIDYSDGLNVLCASDDRDFAQKIEYLASNPAQAAEIGDKAREYALRHFSPSVNESLTKRLLQEVVMSTRTPVSNNHSRRREG